MALTQLLVPRVPDVEPRLRRFTEAIQSILNGLILNGLLVQTDVDSWEIANGAFYTGSGAPASTLGQPGDHYLDLQTGILYKLF